MTNLPSDKAIKEAIRTLAVLRGLASQVQVRCADVSKRAGLLPTPIPFKDTDRTMIVGEACFEVMLGTYRIQKQLLELTNALRLLVDMPAVGPSETQTAFGESWRVLLLEAKEELTSARGS